MIGSQRKRYRRTVDDAIHGMNPNLAVTENYSRLDKLAVGVTGKVGTMKFALVIFSWTLCWLGYQIVGAVTGLWTPFDPLPGVVLYLLVSNVIQICLMPLIMVGQNMQSRQQEAKAEQDYRNNREAVFLLRMLVSDMSPEQWDKAFKAAQNWGTLEQEYVDEQVARVA